MKIINRYICWNLLTTLALAIVVLSFILVVGSFAKLSGLLAQGVSVIPLLQLVLLKLPQILGYTIPFGLLLSTILLFNRMSVDYEITAVRASGVSLLQISAPAILLSMLLSFLCGWLQLYIAPNFNHDARWLVREQGVRDPLTILDEGRFVEIFDGTKISIDKRDGDWVENIHIYRLDDQGRLRDDIHAREGRLIVHAAEKILDVHLSSVSFNILDPENPGNRSATTYSSEFKYSVDYGSRFNRRPLSRRPKQMNLTQLLTYIVLYTEAGDNPAPLFVEAHKRVAMAFAPVSFILLAIPLGLQINRRERSPGILIGVGVMLLYYGLLTIFETVQDKSIVSPHVLMWLPNIACQVVGLMLLWRKR